jgi:hypothetical protein
MRTEKELLKLMLWNQENFVKGICGWIFSLNCHGIITKDECILIMDYIAHNRPSKFSSLSAFKNRRGAYYWNKGDITPRIKWIKKQIEKL